MLTGAPGHYAFPTWSPDSTKIACHYQYYSQWEICLINADGTNQVQLTSNTVTDSFPAWSPDGTRIAFVSDRDGNEEVYVMNADGTNQTRLTSNPSNDGHPSWSPR